MTVQQLIDQVLGYLDSGTVYLDTPVVVKHNDRTYVAEVSDDGSNLFIALGAPAPDATAERK